jgi:hypothetical protein
MGLDMYAARKVDVKQWDFESPEERYTVQIARGGKPVRGIQSDRISVVEEEVMYWRKANHIHNWFVQNVMWREDPNDGRQYFVGCDQIRDLLRTCNKVIKASKLVDGEVHTGNMWVPGKPGPVELREPGKVIKDPTVARQLLPTRPGPFFGNTEYNEFYLSQVVATRDWASRVLKDCKDGVPGDIYYSSSW